jgi:hypothetical protein
MPIDYNNGKIYKLIAKDGHYYIGSTSTTLSTRFSHHKHVITNGKATSNYKYFETIPINDIRIELIENCPCDSKKELLEREEHFINLSKKDPLCLNTRSAFLSEEAKKEKNEIYYKENKEILQEKMKKYYEDHKEDIIEEHRFYTIANKEKVDAYHAEYRKEHAEERREYSKKYAEEHPEWKKASRKAKYEKNKAKELEQSKKYKEEHKEKIAEQKLAWQRKKRAEYLETHAEEIAKKKEEKLKKKEERIAKDREITKCECGGSYQQYQKKRHMESKKHKSYVSA